MAERSIERSIERTLTTILMITVVVLLAFSIWLMTTNLTLKGEVRRLTAQVQGCQSTTIQGQEGR
jgi:cell division protein FtsL